MTDSFALPRRLRARVMPPSPRRRTPEERAELLMGAVTMAEIRHAARLLGLTFNEAYRERMRLYAGGVGSWAGRFGIGLRL